MRAAVVGRYGPPDVVRVVDVPRPEPRANEVLVRVRAAAVTSGDARIRAARFPAGFGSLGRLALGLRGPRRSILGGCFSGVIDSTGRGVQGFAPGDDVCGMTGTRMGTHAEYVAVPVKKLVRKPSEVSHDDAAGVLFGGTTALYFLRDKAKVGTGTTVLVNGASGAVGTNAVQLARHLGATVTAVTSAANTDLVRTLGATHVIDRHEQDVNTLGERFDVVFDAVGNISTATGRALLNDGGTLVLAVATLGETLRARKPVVTGPMPERVSDMTELLGLLASGELTVVHDCGFDLDQIAGAYRVVDGGRKVGNVVLRP